MRHALLLLHAANPDRKETPPPTTALVNAARVSAFTNSRDKSAISAMTSPQRARALPAAPRADPGRRHFFIFFAKVCDLLVQR